MFKSFGGVDAAMSRCYLLPEHCETTKKLLPAAARKGYEQIEKVRMRIETENLRKGLGGPGEPEMTT